MNRPPDERGSITPFAVIMALVILMLAGLVVDGGRQLNAKGRAVAYAQEAARAGSQVVDIADPRLDLLPDQALQAASQYCAEAMSHDSQLTSCTPTMTTVHDAAGAFLAVKVSAHIEEESILLGLIHKPLLTATGSAMARPISGISQADTGKQTTEAPPTVVPPGDQSAPPTAAPPPDPTILPCTPRPTKTPKPPKPSGSPGKPTKPTKPKPPPHPYCHTPTA